MSNDATRTGINYHYRHSGEALRCLDAIIYSRLYFITISIRFLAFFFAWNSLLMCSSYYHQSNTKKKRELNLRFTWFSRALRVRIIIILWWVTWQLIWKIAVERIRATEHLRNFAVFEEFWWFTKIGFS